MKRHIPPRMLVLTALFAGLTAAGAFLRIPTPWSAFTLQVLFVFLAGAFLGPFVWGLYSKRVSKPAVWASFIIAVGLTTGNMLAGMFGHPLIASPINCGALAMILSLVVVPLVNLVTPAVPFEIEPPSPEGAIDREFARKVEDEDIPLRPYGSWD